METLFQELKGSVSKQQSDTTALNDNFPNDNTGRIMTVLATQSRRSWIIILLTTTLGRIVFFLQSKLCPLSTNKNIPLNFIEIQTRIAKRKDKWIKIEVD